MCALQTHVLLSWSDFVFVAACDQVVIREFRTFDVSHEFRGFIHKKKLTALTQYNGVSTHMCYAGPRHCADLSVLTLSEFCFFPFLLKNKDAIASKIMEEFKTMIKVQSLESDLVLD